MTWDHELYMPKSGVLTTDSETHEKFVKRCAECNKVLSIVSRTIYEIDNKPYCSGCYSKKVNNLAVERDHDDLKEPNRQQV